MRAVASGEIKEYRMNAVDWIPLSAPNSVWYDWLKPKFIKLAAERSGDADPFMKIKQ